MSLNDFRLDRRAFASVVAVSGASLASPALWAQPRPEKGKITVAVEGQAGFENLPLTIAEQLGYFRAEGLNLEIHSFSNASAAWQAAHRGAVDVISGTYEDTIDLQSRGQEFQAFVLQGRTPGISMGVSTKSMPNYKTVADLRGKRIGISAPGSQAHKVAKLILWRAGLTADDVSFVGLGTPAAVLIAWRAGQIDAVSHIDPVMTMLEQTGEIRIIADTRTLKGTHDVFGGPMPAGCLYAPLGFVKKNPNTVQALADAVVHGLKWLQTAGPSDIIKTVPEAYLLGDRALYLAAFNKVRQSISPDGLIPEEGPRTALKALARFDPAIKVDQIQLSSTYTNEFATKAKERFKA